MRIMTRNLNFLPLFNRHKTMWQSAMKLRKKIRKAQEKLEVKKQDYINYLERKKVEMSQSFCPFLSYTEKNRGSKCVGCNCIHYDSGYLTYKKAKGHRYLDRVMVYGTLDCGKCSCKLWGKAEY